MSSRRPRSPALAFAGLRRRSARRPSVRLDSRLRHDEHAPRLLLSPHWDDAALDCWSLLGDGGELTVVNMFAGIPPPGRAGVWEAVGGLRDSAERARARMAEDERALALAGRRPLNLPLLDAQYRSRTAAPTLQTLDSAIAERVASASHVYVPAGIGSHVDHLLARSYGRALLRAGFPVTVYAELPYCTFHGWPPWVDGSEPAPNRNVDAYWQSCLAGVPELPPLRSATVARLDGAQAAVKRAALQCYEASLNYGVRRLMSDPAFHRFEVRWQLLGGGARD